MSLQPLPQGFITNNATIKILGQVAPATNTLTLLYQVPELRAAMCYVTVANRGANSETFRIAISYGGETTANKDYIAYDTVIQGNHIFTYPIPLFLSNSDTIRVYTSNGLSFSCFGYEISQDNVYEPIT
jgi:hypothetical protein